MATETRKKTRREAARKWREAHPEQNRARQRAYAQKRRVEEPEKVRENQARHVAANPDANRAKASRYRGKKTGWDETSFAAAWVRQVGCCEICGVEMLRDGQKSNSVARDHDHATGHRRDLLCFNCNRALGLLRDSVDRIRRALAYILKHTPLPERWDEV